MSSRALALGPVDRLGGERERCPERALSVGILADMLEEGWPSMDLVADVLMRELPRQPGRAVTARLVRPPLVPVIRRIRRGADGAGSTADRVFNRFWLYRRALRGLARRCDVFHVVDHSYAHLALALPRGRAVVTCHDTDTFRGFVTPGVVETGLPPFLVRRLAAGLGRAARVACPSHATADALIDAGLAERERIVVVPNGVDEMPCDDEAEREATALLGPGATVDVLHVGSTVARKRIDLLLDAFAILSARRPDARLVRIGGPFTPEQVQQVARLGIGDRLVVLPFLARATLHAVYRRAALLLMTSDREGFGLPVVEAMSARLPVVARDLPVLREVAGQAASFVDAADPVSWADALSSLLAERDADPREWARRCEAARTRARRFSWSRYAADMVVLYAAVASEASASLRSHEASR